jgi:putative zinc finger protein
MHAQHISDEDLLLDYYGETTPEQRALMRAHVESCAECRTMDRQLRAVLALVDSEPMPEAPPGFEREMWSRLEPDVVSACRRTAAVRLKPETAWSFEFPRWALAASVAALAVGSFALGRVWDTPTTLPTIADSTATRELGERMLRSEVEEHLERSQRVLVELVNGDDSAPVLLASDRERAADLVAAGRLYRRSAEQMGDGDTRDLLEDVERVLVEIANGPDVESSNNLSDVRARITDQDLIFRLRVMTAAMQARERRARPTW